MEQRDHLEKQIEAMGQFLARLFSKLASKDLAATESNDVNRELKEELGFDVDELLQMTEEDFVPTLLDTGKFDADNLEKLADVLAEVARQNEKDLYTRALLIYDYLEQSGGVYSIARNAKINAIRILRGV
ncbi:hypothetical protein AM493_00315 [Flavobacterium akiainvivens]|uniref:Uncharacterized protein n=1 Tax=Flavobacterium akiainvivens TaxID=1202724 RepID=A0A0N0RQB2_9FLAO|nr:DUF6483 family protein [Flavobacterium akiainvivens]KOS04656.1 hypothetical protein AM493_00315 [Flavobacterium akiainvivens]SFQ65365.1 hypothetical protein SAMN05444144_11260 [Flavobacterium akiainvivens]